MKTHMNLEHKIKDGILIITFPQSHLEVADVANFKEGCVQIIENNDASKVVFQLENLQFIDSSGLGSFVSILKLLRAKGGDLKLCNMSKPVRSIFEVVRMYKLFEIYPSQDDAVRSFQV